MGVNMIKAIFFDIDGTLISKQNPRLTDALKKTLDKVREKGILLFIATGRHSSEITDLKLNEDYHFDGYLTLNGCYCYNDQEILHKGSIDKKDVKRIITLLDVLDVACMFVEDNYMYINKVNDRVEIAQAAIHTPVPPVEDIGRALQHDIYQIIPYVTDDEIAEFLKITRTCKGTRWHPLAYDIIGKNGGKSNGIEAVLHHYHLQKEEIMAFGDGHNDIDMLEYAGIGVAMDNAANDVKNASDFVTKSVDEDGILYALEHFSIL